MPSGRGPGAAPEAASAAGQPYAGGVRQLAESALEVGGQVVEVVERVVCSDGTGLGHDTVGQRAQFGELFALDQARDDQVAIAPIVFDLSVGKHVKP